MDSTKLYRLIGSISRQSTTSVNQQVSQLGLDNNLFVYLMRIVENEGLSQVALVTMVRVDKTTLSRALNKLIAEGYIDKVTDPQNKKFKNLYPTKEGKEVYNHLYRIEQAYIQNALKDVSPSEQLTLGKTLEKIYNAL
ncbi:MarR family winged helix-turn-helix transcriptional regulator [Pediococcus ethanolidurans]|uniref:DNA-binding transcriptional regulator, MarR family n=1 Tax=Pediococcus ethanolidurans TaxID=319653 RepID=A0A0R2K981_9LACO|nr:MarR family transcriptional regulator [Pediococcus ethanolidurans]KRN83047.1 hypothetical protein IV87_GL001758 [Pediococcus ethanolidurans]GEN94200.1 transcriptional regulator [Pediococcus ethanolidurans]SER08541.1 DNA-binding transcriptional regulator, MarR family [Pediococcus ethanolidurans]